MLLFPKTGLAIEPLSAGATLLRGFAAADSPRLCAVVEAIAAVAPYRHMTTPGGFRMSVAMTNCGAAGWVTDRNGYRYSTTDPLTHLPWPAIPALFSELAANAAKLASFPDYLPDACLINCYEPGARMSLHQDRNERDYTAPIVSISLGLPAVFLFGGARRSDRPRRLALDNGDAVVWGGPDRLNFHGVAPLARGDHPLTGRYRINLTFRKAL